MDKFTVDGPAAAANLRFERDRGADRRGRPGRARGARAGPGQPRPGRARGPPRPRRVGGRGRRGAAQGPPARATTTPTRWSGTGSPGPPSTASASPRSARRSCSTGWSPRGRPTRPGAWDIRAHLAVARRQGGQRDAAHRPRGRGHLAVARGRRGHRLERPARPGAARPRAGRPADDRGRRPRLPAVRRAAASCTRAPTSASTPGDATRELADQAWQAGRARLRRRRDRGPRPGRVRRAGARPLAGRRRGATCAA